MARITYVKKAQQRYATVAVLNADGSPKQTPMIDSRTKVQKVTKTGRPVFLTITVADKTQPLPPLTCDACSQPIAVGTPYQHVTPKSGPYGGTQRSRHGGCPTWKVWDLSNSWSARIAQVTEPALEGFEPDGPEDVTARAEEIAQEIRDLAEQSTEAADNIEEGFGHETSQSEEARERADNLESWADEIEGVDAPDLPDPEDEDCGDCTDGQVLIETLEASPGDVDPQETADCTNCDGTGQVTPDEPTEDQMNDWRNDAIDALQGVLDNCPV